MHSEWQTAAKNIISSCLFQQQYFNIQYIPSVWSTMKKKTLYRFTALRTKQKIYFHWFCVFVLVIETNWKHLTVTVVDKICTICTYIYIFCTVLTFNAIKNKFGKMKKAIIIITKAINFENSVEDVHWSGATVPFFVSSPSLRVCDASIARY